MRAVRIGKHIVKIYDSIEEMPVVRFKKYNKLLLIDAGIGADLSDFDMHTERILRYIKDGKKDLAKAELVNMRQNLYFIQTQLQPKYLSFCCLIAEMDGKECKDISDEGLKALSEDLEMTEGQLTEEMASVKKKIAKELRLYFPSLFDDPGGKEYADKLRRRTLLLLGDLAEDNMNDGEVESLTDELVTFNTPRNFSGPASEELAYDKEFETMSLILSENLHVDTKKFNVLQYYNAYDYIKKQSQRAKQKYGR